MRFKRFKNSHTELGLPVVRHNKNADAILGNRASYAHALSPVERVSCVRPGSLLVGHRSHECSQYMCMTIKREKNKFGYLNSHVTLISSPKNCPA